MSGGAFVYVLRCADGSLYTGWTVDVERRLAAHGAGTASRYTRSRRPVELAASWEQPGRSEAMREEARIKALPREREAQAAGRSATANDASRVTTTSVAPFLPTFSFVSLPVIADERPDHLTFRVRAAWPG